MKPAIGGLSLWTVDLLGALADRGAHKLHRDPPKGGFRILVVGSFGAVDRSYEDRVYTKSAETRLFCPRPLQTESNPRIAPAKIGRGMSGTTVMSRPSFRQNVSIERDDRPR
jgi:hypothetical protein